MNLDSLAKSGHPSAARRAEQLLTRVEKLYEDGYYEDKPDVVSYNVVINCWTKSGDRKCAQHAERLLQQMEELYANGNEDVKPNTITFNTVLSAWTRSPDKDAPDRALEMLNLMEDLYASGNHDVMPNVRSYNLVIETLLRRKKLAAADALFKKMITGSDNGAERLAPNVYTFNTILKTYSNLRPPRVTEAQQLYDVMIARAVPPDNFTYTNLVTALARGNSPDAAERASDFLKTLLLPKSPVKPNKFLLTAVIDAFAKVGNAEGAELVYAMFREDDVLKPDCVTLTALLKAHARSGSPTGASKAEALLRDALLNYSEPSQKPNRVSFATVVNAYARRGDPNGAERVFRLAESASRTDPSLRPDTYVYNALVDAVAKSSKGNKVAKASRLLKQMEESDNPLVVPTVVTYNTVINTAASCYGDKDRRRQAMAVAVEAFRTVHGNDALGGCTSVTYAAFIKACRHLLPVGEERRTVVQRSWTLCREEGLVNEKVFNEFKKACGSEEELKEGMDGIDGEKNFPKEWKRNAARNFARKK